MISGVAFSGDGTQVMTSSPTSAVKIWDVGPSGGAEWANVDNLGDVVFARAGRELITSSVVDGTVTALDIDTGQQRLIGSVRSYGNWHDVNQDLSPDGLSIAIRLRARLRRTAVERSRRRHGQRALRDQRQRPGGRLEPERRVPGGGEPRYRLDLRSFGARGRTRSRAAAGVGSARTASSPRTVRTSPSRSGIGGATRSSQRSRQAPRGWPSTPAESGSPRTIWRSGTWPAKKVDLRLPVRPTNVTLAFSPDGTRLAVGSAGEVRYSMHDRRGASGVARSRSGRIRQARVQSGRVDARLHRRTTARASGRSTSTICSQIARRT